MTIYILVVDFWRFVGLRPIAPFRGRSIKTSTTCHKISKKRRFKKALVFFYMLCYNIVRFYARRFEK